MAIVFTMWAQSYQSPEAVKKLLVHGDGTFITKGEAQALLDLVDEEGAYVVEELFSIGAQGKFLFLFTAYKAMAVDQFAVFPQPVEGLSFTFNGNDIAEQQTEEGGSDLWAAYPWYI